MFVSTNLFRDQREEEKVGIGTTNGRRRTSYPVDWPAVTRRNGEKERVKGRGREEGERERDEVLLRLLNGDDLGARL